MIAMIINSIYNEEKMWPTCIETILQTQSINDFIQLFHFVVITNFVWYSQHGSKLDVTIKINDLKKYFCQKKFANYILLFN